ncbi:MAG: HD domain-containing protein [Firmicutes bacterium]|nr:HD domain-containing protein [Bacillota bacterium]
MNLVEQLYKVLNQTPIDKEALVRLVPVLRELDEMDYYHPAHLYGVLDHSIKAAELVDDVYLRLVLIFHDVGKLVTEIKVPHWTDPTKQVSKTPGHETESIRIAKEILGEHMNPKEADRFLALVRYHDTSLVNEHGHLLMTELMEQYGQDFIQDMLVIQQADMKTHTPAYYESKKPKLRQSMVAFQQLIAKNENISKSDFNKEKN